MVLQQQSARWKHYFSMQNGETRQFFEKADGSHF